MTGYPPEDLLLRPEFVKEAERSLEQSRARPAASSRSSARRISSATCTTGSRSGSRRGEDDLPQALAPELRRVRRAPLLRPRPASRPARVRRRARSAPPSARTSGSRDRPPPTSPSRARVDREHLGLAVPRRKGTASASRCWPLGARQRVLRRVRECRRGPGRARSSTDTRWCWMTRVRSSPAPGFEEALLIVDVDPIEAVGRRLRDVRRWTLESERSRRRDSRRSHRRSAGDQGATRSSRRSRRCSKTSSR